MTVSTSRPSKGHLPDFYFRGSVNWFTDDSFVAINRSAAYGLYWALVAWSRGKLTDGRVPLHMARSLATAVKASPKRDLAELCRVGLLGELEDGFLLVDFFEWQESSEVVAARREKAQRAADARWNAASNAPSNAPSMPDAMQRQRQRQRSEVEAENSQRSNQELVPMPKDLIPIPKIINPTRRMTSHP